MVYTLEHPRLTAKHTFLWSRKIVAGGVKILMLIHLLLSFSVISAASNSSGLSGGIVAVIAIVVVIAVASVILLMVMVGAIFRRNKFKNRGQAVAG